MYKNLLPDYKNLLPDYNNYLRYAAYVKVRDSIINEVELRNVKRLSSTTLCSIAHKLKLDLATKCVANVISPHDSVEELLKKKYEAELVTDYYGYVCEAISAFMEVVHNLDRPTVNTLEKLLNSQIKIVAADLLGMRGCADAAMYGA